MRPARSQDERLAVEANGDSSRVLSANCAELVACEAKGKERGGRRSTSRTEDDGGNAEGKTTELEDGEDLKLRQAASCQPSLFEAMSVDTICEVLAGVMISSEESFQGLVPLLSGCFKRVPRQNCIAADSIVDFPEAKLFAMI